MFGHVGADHHAVSHWLVGSSRPTSGPSSHHSAGKVGIYQDFLPDRLLKTLFLGGVNLEAGVSKLGIDWFRWWEL